MTENELLQELLKELAYPEIEPNEITVRMLAQNLGVTERMAYQHLKDREAKGLLKSRYVRGDHKRILAFSKVE